MRKRADIHRLAASSLLYAIAFLLPFGRLVPLCIGLLFLNWLIEGEFKQKFSAIRYPRIFALVAGFYFLHVLGFLYTDDRVQGLFDLQMKLSLLIFPLVLLTGDTIREWPVGNYLIAFTSGCLIAALFCLLHAGYVWLEFHENHFTYMQLSWFLHPSYFAMYINLSIAYIVLMPARHHVVIRSILVLFLSFFIFLLSSKAGIITWVLLMFFFTMRYAIHRKKLKESIVALLLVVVAFFSIARFAHLNPLSRFAAITNVLNNAAADKTTAESNAVRVLIWEASLEIIKEHFWTGIGTGDDKGILQKAYMERGMTGALAKKLNAHNQFFQTFIALGVAGFLLLVALLVAPLYQAGLEKNAICAVFLALCLLNFMTESMLEAQAGVMYYSFFNALLINFRPSTHPAA